RITTRRITTRRITTRRITTTRITTTRRTTTRRTTTTGTIEGIMGETMRGVEIQTIIKQMAGTVVVEEVSLVGTGVVVFPMKSERKCSKRSKVEIQMPAKR
ncbi:MAG: hypothetical protein MPJ24_04560, partial [Pirellulaceae bacterium]|nr:hypothetical protein [Pirellulaceae bacterium]